MSEPWRDDFPALADGMVYLDSAATTLKPQPVIDAVRWFLEGGTAAVHRAVHAKSVAATDRFEATREALARWFGADTDEVVFSRGATEAINLVRRGLPSLGHVAVTVMEHHSNFVPWMDVPRCDRISVDTDGNVNEQELKESLAAGAQLVAVTHQSNVLGAVTDLRMISELVQKQNAALLVDAAQSASHDPPQLHDLKLDFIACSAHKMLGPSGAGALIVDRKWYPKMRPSLLGGHMVEQVHLDGWTMQSPPHSFEAGTPAIESVIGWGAAVNYLQQLGPDAIADRLATLTDYLLQRLGAIPGLNLVGPVSGRRGPLAAFHLEGMEATAVARIVSQRDQICVRSGYHCAQPLHEHLSMAPTVRASLQLYNNEQDIDRFCSVLDSVAKIACM
nr:cysteine desulfurase [Rhodopirellula sp. SM50]